MGLRDAATQASVWRRGRVSASLEGSRDPFNDVAWTVFFDHSDYVPTETLEHLRSPDVLYVLFPVCSVVVAVVFKSDHLMLPAHIEVCDEMAIGYSNLCGRRGKSSMTRTSLNQDSFGDSAPASIMSISIVHALFREPRDSDQLGSSSLLSDSCRARESVEVSDGGCSAKMARKIKAGSGRCGNRDAGKAT